jgi:hypothetical protein
MFDTSNIELAEIKPVEPEQGNSCEGKVALFIYSPLSVALFLFPFFNLKIKTMKKLLGTLAFACMIQLAFAQKISVIGVVIDEKISNQLMVQSSTLTMSM